MAYIHTSHIQKAGRNGREDQKETHSWRSVFRQDWFNEDYEPNCPSSNLHTFKSNISRFASKGGKILNIITQLPIRPGIQSETNQDVLLRRKTGFIARKFSLISNWFSDFLWLPNHWKLCVENGGSATRLSYKTIRRSVSMPSHRSRV